MFFTKNNNTTIITSSALLYATHFISSSLNNQIPMCGNFFDLKKAFDSVPHRPLIQLLANLGTPQFLVNWLHSYLSNYSQSVYYNGFSSENASVTSGVPQGSILGPLLFLLYIDSICQCKLSPQSRLILYATTSFSSTPSVPSKITH